MLGQASVGIDLADLVHFASQLGQKLDSNHAVIGRALKMKPLKKSFQKNIGVKVLGGTW